MAKKGGELKKSVLWIGAFFLTLFWSECVLSNSLQTEVNVGAPKVFLDNKMNYPASLSFDVNFIKTEIPFVQYVWDRRDADLHVMFTSQDTGSNGSEFEIVFIGQHNFLGVDDTLKGYIHTTDSDEQSRGKLVHLMKLGLIRYMARTPLADQFSLQFNAKRVDNSVRDPWDSWIFSLSSNGYFSGQESSRFSYITGSFSADRVTPNLKIRLSTYGSYDESFYKLEDEDVISHSESFGFSGMLVKSVGSHWSIGLFGAFVSSTYNNYKASYTLSPAIEYNLFPYTEAIRKQLRLQYRVNFNRAFYRDMTIFDVMDDFLLSQSLEVAWSAKKNWGTLGGSVVFSHYFHDVKKNNLYCYGMVSLKVWKGLSINVSARYSRIRDQLSLTKGDASNEDILLQIRQLATSYSYSTSFGISYSFGSIYSNAVNPRFGNSF